MTKKRIYNKSKLLGVRKWTSVTEEWTRGEMEALVEAERSLNPKDKKFWQNVSNRVGGKTAVECQSKWFERFKSPRERKPRRDVSEKVMKLAGKKTQKFQKQVREFVRREEKNHSDDIFKFQTPGKDKVLRHFKLDSPVLPLEEVLIIPEEDDELPEENRLDLLQPVTESQRCAIDSYIHSIRDISNQKLLNYSTGSSSRVSKLKPKLTKRSVKEKTRIGSTVLRGLMTPGGTTRVETMNDSD